MHLPFDDILDVFKLDFQLNLYYLNLLLFSLLEQISAVFLKKVRTFWTLDQYSDSEY